MNRALFRKMYSCAIPTHATVPISHINENVVHHLNSCTGTYNSNIANILISIDRNTQNIIIEHDSLSKYEKDFMLPKIKNLIKRYYPNFYHHC